MRKTWLVAVFSLPLLAAEWPQEPDGLKGVKFGMTPTEGIAANEDLHCRPQPNPALCTLDIKFGTFGSQAIFIVRDGKIANVSGSFPSEHYSDVREAFITKYGDPHESQEQPVSTRVGAKYENQILHWRGRTVSVMVERYGSTVSKGVFVIATLDELEGISRKQTEANKKALD